MTNQFLHLSNHTINPTQISYIDWNYREGSGDTPFIRIIVGYEDILLGVDSLDSKVLSDYIESTKTKREPTKAGITVDDLPDTKTNNQFINFSTHTVRLASIDLIDWDYRDSGDTQFIRVVVGCEVILLNVDSEDAGILYEYGLKGALNDRKTKLEAK